jgi:hypothetical protein
VLELMSMSVLQDGKFDFRDLQPIFQSDYVTCFSYSISQRVDPLYRDYPGQVPCVTWDVVTPTFIHKSTGKNREDAWLRITLRDDENTYPIEFLDDVLDVPP